MKNQLSSSSIRTDTFCRLMAIGKSKTDALKGAGYAARNTSMADKLLAKPEVNELLNKYIADFADKVEVNVGKLIRTLEEISEKGQTDSARVGAIRLILEYAGKIGDNKQSNIQESSITFNISQVGGEEVVENEEIAEVKDIEVKE